MEKRIATLIVFFFTTFSFVFAQDNSSQKIRLYLWALKDAYPEIKEDKPYDQAKLQITSLSEYLLNAMTYGIDFVYTPSDKLRNVSEYFECKMHQSFDSDKKNIEYDSVYFREDKIFCWVNFQRSSQMNIFYKQMSNIKNPRVRGKGKGRLSKGFTGTQEAIENSIKDGIREYYRKIIKNKPKEITGTILIKNVPAIYIESGWYIVELDFFLQTSKIKEYNQF